MTNYVIPSHNKCHPSQAAVHSLVKRITTHLFLVQELIKYVYVTPAVRLIPFKTTTDTLHYSHYLVGKAVGCHSGPEAN